MRLNNPKWKRTKTIFKLMRILYAQIAKYFTRTRISIKCVRNVSRFLKRDFMAKTFDDNYVPLEHKHAPSEEIDGIVLSEFPAQVVLLDRQEQVLELPEKDGVVGL